MRQKVETVLQDIIRPLIQVDGGKIKLVSCDDNLIVLELSGACSGCPGRPFTVSGVIEPAIKKAVGEAVTISYQYDVPTD